MRKDPAKTVILFTVLAGHCFFLFYLHAFFSPEPKRPHKPLIVKTITPAAAPVEKLATASPPSGPKKTSEAPSKTQTPPKPKEKEQPKPSPAGKKAPPIADKQLSKEKKPVPAAKPQDDKRAKMSQKLLQELEDSLSKLEVKPDKKAGKKQSSSQKLDLPGPIDAMHSEGAFGPSDYLSTLVGYLKQTLNLPEYGEVKIQLTLKQDGSVVKLVVIKTESEKNRKYLETSLPHLRFPHLLENKKQETFIVTFCNEI